FTQELDRSRLDATTVWLTKLPAGPAGESSSVIDAAVASNDANPNVLVLTPRAPLAPGRYALRARNDAITGLSGDVFSRGDTSVSTLMTFTIGAQP
ncbi:MAG TPA: hypothetical protein VF902_09400, partial [Coriobacteriia bacterium]